ncbi:MAG: hypothetical protein ACWGOD_02175 [Desulfobulbales bacterium]
MKLFARQVKVFKIADTTKITMQADIFLRYLYIITDTASDTRKIASL